MVTPSKEPDALVLDSGLIPVTVQRDGKPTTFQVDLFMLNVSARACTKRHNLPTDSDGSFEMTEEFIAELAAKFDALGISGCTAWEAAQIWTAAIAAMNVLQKKTSGTPSSRSGSTSTRQRKQRKKK